MEKQISTRVPQNFKEALRLALEQQEELENLRINKLKTSKY